MYAILRRTKSDMKAILVEERRLEYAQKENRDELLMRW